MRKKLPKAPTKPYIRPPPMTWLKMKDSAGKTYTVRNFVYIFSWSKYFVYDTDEEQIQHVRGTLQLEVNSIVKLYGGNPKVISERLGGLLLPTLKREEKPLYKKYWKNYSDDVRTQLKITPEQVEAIIRKSLDVGNYRRESKRVVSLFWVVDSFLKRLPITLDSKWQVLSNSNIEDYMETSSEKLMKQHVKFREPYLRDIQSEMEKKLEKSILEKLKDKVKQL